MNDKKYPVYATQTIANASNRIANIILNGLPQIVSIEGNDGMATGMLVRTELSANVLRSICEAMILDNPTRNAILSIIEDYSEPKKEQITIEGSDGIIYEVTLNISLNNPAFRRKMADTVSSLPRHIMQSDNVNLILNCAGMSRSILDNLLPPTNKNLLRIPEL